MRALLDSNVLVSGTFFEGNELLLIDLLSQPPHQWVCANYVLSETSRVLREKLGPSLKAVDALIKLDFYAETAFIVSDERLAPHLPWAKRLIRDVSDAPILAAAFAARVDVLATGDDDFFHLKGPVPFEVLTPAQALARLQ